MNFWAVFITNLLQILSFLGCSLEFLNILSSISALVLPQNHPDFLSQIHIMQLDSLELRLRSIEQHNDLTVLQSKIERSRSERIAQLYQLAGLIYLHRAARRTKIGFPPTEILVQEAFGIVEGLECCEASWPLFIIGCEARSDEGRLKIQGIFSKTLEMRDNGNIRSIKRMIEAAWIQDDLCEGQEMDYFLRINALISAHNVLPTFM